MSAMTIRVFSMPGILTTPISRPVKTPSTTKMTMYCLRSTCAIELASRWAGRDQVDECKHQDPDEIDEVPEQAADLDVVVVAVIVLAHRDANEHDDEVRGSGEHVEPVEAGDAVERGRVVRRAEAQPLLVQPRVLLGLAAQE